jgi:hypothetical protein
VPTVRGFVVYRLPLKDKSLVEMSRSAVCWVLWLARNNVYFRMHNDHNF